MKKIIVLLAFAISGCATLGTSNNSADSTLANGYGLLAHFRTVVKLRLDDHQITPAAARSLQAKADSMRTTLDTVQTMSGSTSQVEQVAAVLAGAGKLIAEIPAWKSTEVQNITGGNLAQLVADADSLLKSELTIGAIKPASEPYALSVWVRIRAVDDLARQNLQHAIDN